MEGRTCLVCGLAFNQTDRHFLMLPCADGLCLACFEAWYKPQAQKLPCPVCAEELSINAKFLKSVDGIKRNSQVLWVHCDAHTEKPTEYLCTTHRELVCHECALQEHADHREALFRASSEMVDAFCDRSLHRIARMRD